MVAIPILTVATIFDRQDFGYAAPAIAFLGYVNVVIALANLAPAPGFDGHIAWRVVPLLWKRQRPPPALAGGGDRHRSHLRRLPPAAGEQPQREQADRGLGDEHGPEHARVLPAQRQSPAATPAGSGSARRTRG